MPSTGRRSMGGLKNYQNWHVFGRVLSFDGKGISGAKVHMDVGGGIGSVQEVETDLLGRFSEDFSLNARQFETLTVKLLVTKSNYQPARATVEFSKDTTREIDVTMLGAREDPNQLSQHDLIERLAPRLKNARDELPESARKKYTEQATTVFDGHETTKSVKVLEQLCKTNSKCVDCATLMSLALLETGDWNAATKRATEAAEANEDSAHPRPEPLLLIGVMESWQHEPKKAATFFTEALNLKPDDAIALEELGRMQLQVNDDDAAEKSLAKAIRAGAPADARLLRVRALMGVNDIPTAHSEMDKYMAGRDLRELPWHVRLVYERLKARMGLSAYGRVKSFVTEPLPDIEKIVPELKGIRPGKSQAMLPEILDKTGQSVRDFFNHFPDTVCVEHVEQESLKISNGLSSRSKQTFRYLLMAKPENREMGLEEYRTDNKGRRTGIAGYGRGLMLTSGFASASLVFLPAYQTGSDFRLLGVEDVDGRHANVIAFAQNPKRSRFMEVFTGNGTSVLILVQGLAWVDARGDILRLRTDLLKPASKVRLVRQTTQIEYAPVAFKTVAKKYWLPHEVIVSVGWNGRMLQNKHRYSDFQLFHVKASENRKSSEVRQDQKGPGK